VVACPHDKAPFGSPICRHLRECREPALGYVKWYIGSAILRQTTQVCRAGIRKMGREPGISTTSLLPIIIRRLASSSN